MSNEDIEEIKDVLENLADRLQIIEGVLRGGNKLEVKKTEESIDNRYEDLKRSILISVKNDHKLMYNNFGANSLFLSDYLENISGQYGYGKTTTLNDINRNISKDQETPSTLRMDGCIFGISTRKSKGRTSQIVLDINCIKESGIRDLDDVLERSWASGFMSDIDIGIAINIINKQKPISKIELRKSLKFVSRGRLNLQNIKDIEKSLNRKSNQPNNRRETQ